MMSVLEQNTTIDINTKPNKLIRQELQNLNQDTETLNHSDVRLFRKSMNEVRRKIFPIVARTLIEAKPMIYECKGHFFLKVSHFVSWILLIVSLLLQMLLICQV